MIKYATQPLGFWGLVKKTFASYVTIYKRAWQIVLLAAILSFIAGLGSVLSTGMLVLVTVVLFLIAALLSAMILYQGDGALSGKQLHLSDSFRVASKCYLPFLISYFVISILMFLIMLFLLMTALTMGPGLGGLATYFNTQMTQLPPWWAIIFFIFVIIFLILLVFLYVGPALVVLYKKGAFAGFKQSADLVKNHWWRVFGILLIVYVVWFVVFLIIGFVFPANQSLLLGLRGFIFQLLVYPLQISATLNILKDLQLRSGKK